MVKLFPRIAMCMIFILLIILVEWVVSFINAPIIMQPSEWNFFGWVVQICLFSLAIMAGWAATDNDI